MYQASPSSSGDKMMIHIKPLASGNARSRGNRQIDRQATEDAESGSAWWWEAPGLTVYPGGVEAVVRKGLLGDTWAEIKRI